MNDVTRIGGYSGQLNMEQIEKLRALAAARMAGTTLNSAPVAPPPAPVEPIRMPPPEAVQGWRASVDQDINRGVVPNPAALPAAVPAMPLATPKPPIRFPTDGVPAVANVTAPTGPGGITLTSAPVAPGWAGTVGLPSTPEEAKAFEKGGDYQKLMGSLDEVAKGLNPKAPADPNASVISPMTSQPNQPNQLSAELMNTLLQSKRKPRGLTLAG